MNAGDMPLHASLNRMYLQVTSLIRDIGSVFDGEDREYLSDAEERESEVDAILYLIERYIFENVFQALTHYFNLRLPIKPKQRDFFKKFLQLIQKATSYCQKELHKDKARELFKTIKKIP